MKLLTILIITILITGCGSKNINTSGKSKFDNPISIEAVEGLDEDFMFGCDLSSLIAEENSGVVFYNEKGDKQDPVKTLADNGVNMIRVRVWNNPYDENGNGYGGGNCDTDNAIAIGKRATECKMAVLIDYHYSDFWTDPSKQMCPKTWANMDIEEKSDALYEYTKESLGRILESGVNVTMVQLGNEITTGMAGETDWKKITMLLNSGSRAVRELSETYNREIQIAVHFTNPEKEGTYINYAETLKNYNVDYDIFATSYYSFWHGTTANLKSVLSEIVEAYGKKVMVAETSYAYTYDDGDGHRNTVSKGTWNEYKYELSVQGQAYAIRDCVEALASLGENAVGICYWEPAWIPVPDDTEMTRSQIWEKYGSGWASSYASEYDSEDVGKYYGGSSWDNQALFDFEGHPLPSIEMFKIMRG